MKHIIYLPLIVLIMAFSSCGTGKDSAQPKKPDYIIPKDQLVDIMVDIYIVESANNMRILDRDTTNPSYGDFFSAVMEKHDFALEDYERSLQYYALDPEEINAIYDETLERLSKMESEAGVVRSGEEEF